MMVDHTSRGDLKQAEQTSRTLGLRWPFPFPCQPSRRDAWDWRGRGEGRGTDLHVGCAREDKAAREGREDGHFDGRIARQRVGKHGEVCSAGPAVGKAQPGGKCTHTQGRHATQRGGKVGRGEDECCLIGFLRIALGLPLVLFVGSCPSFLLSWRFSNLPISAHHQQSLGRALQRSSQAACTQRRQAEAGRPK